MARLLRYSSGASRLKGLFSLSVNEIQYLPGASCAETSDEKIRKSAVQLILAMVKVSVVQLISALNVFSHRIGHIVYICFDFNQFFVHQSDVPGVNLLSSLLLDQIHSTLLYHNGGVVKKSISGGCRFTYLFVAVVPWIHIV